jgi:hypothetical protein
LPLNTITRKWLSSLQLRPPRRARPRTRSAERATNADALRAPGAAVLLAQLPHGQNAGHRLLWQGTPALRAPCSLSAARSRRAARCATPLLSDERARRSRWRSTRSQGTRWP